MLNFNCNAQSHDLIENIIPRIIENDWARLSENPHKTTRNKDTAVTRRILKINENSRQKCAEPISSSVGH